MQPLEHRGGIDGRDGPTEAEEEEEAKSPGRKTWRFAPLVLIGAGLALAYAMGWQHYLSLDFLGDSRRLLNADVAANPVLAPAGFIALYVIAVAFSFPAASVLTIFSGFLFGWLAGGIYAVIGATTGATVLFLAARTAFGGFLRDKAGNGPRACRMASKRTPSAICWC